MTDRDFWLLIYRGIMMVACAIKKKYLDAPPDNQIQAAPQAPPIPTNAVDPNALS